MCRQVSRILIIDDDKVARAMLRQRLEQEAYDVVEADSGSTGLELFQMLCPDLVLVDAVMPTMDGFECCRRLQALPGGQHTPVLMITSLEDETSVKQAFAAGAADFVTKPVQWAILLQRVRRMIGQAHLYQQLETANQALLQLANLDGLTQIANRRRFDQHLEQEWRRLMRWSKTDPQGPLHQSLALILCDIDYFKAYNDHYGHQAGDECLQQVARILQQRIQRPADLASRYGGEEFAITLPETPLAGALQVAHDIRAAIHAAHLPHRYSGVADHITLSFGVASLIPQANQGPEALIASADRLLYRAKQQGRDRICADLTVISEARH